VPGLANYALAADVSAYLPKVPVAQQATWAQLLSAASRGIDGFCERYFYNDTGSTRYFDVPGDPDGSTPIRTFLMGKHDFYGITTVKIAEIENADPAVTGDWVQLTGDGITPPSDFFFEPANEAYIGKTGDVNIKPWSRIELPATPGRTSTTFRDRFVVGKRTLAVTPQFWGWPAIPDQIKDITAKIVVRMHKAQPTGFTGQTGSPEVGAGTILNFLDINDLKVLASYKKQSAG
jgi:hypothetical protein